MTITATAPVRADLNLRLSDTVEIAAPNIADQVRYMTAAGYTVVQIATRLDITAWTAFAAGAHIRNHDDTGAIAASMPPKTAEERAQIRASIVWWATHTIDEITARYGVHRMTAMVMQDFADEQLDSWVRS